MRRGTITFNRQVIRLCKGILKAWEQWVDETEFGDDSKNSEDEKQHSKEELKKEKEPYHKILS